MHARGNILILIGLFEEKGNAFRSGVKPAAVVRHPSETGRILQLHVVCLRQAAQPQKSARNHALLLPCPITLLAMPPPPPPRHDHDQET